MIDDDDRRAVGQGMVYLVAFAVCIIAGAVIAGLALRAFQIVSGI